MLHFRIQHYLLVPSSLLKLILGTLLLQTSLNLNLPNDEDMLSLARNISY